VSAGASEAQIVGTEIEIGLCGEHEIAELRQFIHASWRRDHILSVDERLLRWQFDGSRSLGGPTDGPAVLLARIEGRIVGMLGFMPFEMNARGEKAPGCWLSHWYCSPDVRSRGVAIGLLTTPRSMGYQAIFLIGANKVASSIYSALGFEMMLEMPRWVGVVDVERTAELLAEGAPDHDRDTMRQLCADYYLFGQRDPNGGGGVAVRQSAHRLGADWDTFWTDRIAPAHIGPIKDSPYLNWRYVDHPRFKYEVRLAKGPLRGEILGLTVFRVETIRGRDDRVLRVVEFIATPQAEDPLARSVADAARDSGVLFADFYCSSARAASPLARTGFKRHAATEGSPGFPTYFQPLVLGHSRLVGAFWLSKPLRSDLGQLLDSDGFYITKSDGDQDRPN
jgi:hypothetical protein